MKRVLLVLLAGISLLLSGCYMAVRPGSYYSSGYSTPYYSPTVVVREQFRYKRSFGSSHRSHHGGFKHHHFGENPGPEGETDEALFEPVEQWRVE